MNVTITEDHQARTPTVQRVGPRSETVRLPGGGHPWLGRALFALSVAGLPLSGLVLARLGRRGGVLLAAACTLLFARAVQFAAVGTPARLRTLPRLLAYAELATDGLAAATAFWVWVWQPFAAPRFGARRRLRAPAWAERLSRLAVAVMFILHAARMAIYLSPGRGRSPDLAVPQGR